MADFAEALIADLSREIDASWWNTPRVTRRTIACAGRHTCNAAREEDWETDDGSLPNWRIVYAWPPGMHDVFTAHLRTLLSAFLKSRLGVPGSTTVRSAKKGFFHDVVPASLNGQILAMANPMTTSWSKRFYDPILLADGRKLMTLQDAADYIAALPQAERDGYDWKLAMEALELAGARRDYEQLARAVMMNALEPPSPVPRFVH